MPWASSISCVPAPSQLNTSLVICEKIINLCSERYDWYLTCQGKLRVGRERLPPRPTPKAPVLSPGRPGQARTPAAAFLPLCKERVKKWKGLASYCKAETTFTFYFTILPLSRAFLSINNREMESESGFSFAMASQPF